MLNSRTALEIAQANEKNVKDIDTHWRGVCKSNASRYWEGKPMHGDAYKSLCRASRYLYGLRADGRAATNGYAILLIEAAIREVELAQAWTTDLRESVCRALANADMVILQVSGMYPEWMLKAAGL